MTKTPKSKFSTQELKSRNFLRIARIIFELWEEDRGNTDLLNAILIPDEWVLVGTSVNGGGKREHVVPRVVIYDECWKMFDQGKSIEEAAALIEKFLCIVQITKAEQFHIDHRLNLKSTMPDGWTFENGDVYARLRAANVEFLLLNGELG